MNVTDIKTFAVDCFRQIGYLSRYIPTKELTGWEKPLSNIREKH